MKQTVLITGASRGIGLALCRHFLLNSKDVMIATVRDVSKAEELKRLQSDYSDRLDIQVLDICSSSSRQSFVDALSKKYSAVDVLVNNAGVALDFNSTLKDLSAEVVETTFATNVFATVQMTRVLEPLLRKSKRPIIASMSSLMGSLADNRGGSTYAYRMSKSAVNMFHKCLAIEWPEAVSMALHPGWVQTDMGGSSAPTTPEESAQGLFEVLSRAQTKDSGCFIDFKGQKLPW